MESRKINLTDFQKIPLAPEESVVTFGQSLIVAPHPDDESLGCGGAIALLKKFDLKVSILVLSDGTLSHPNSIKFPKEKLRELRENEIIEAAGILGVEKENITFFRYPDRGIPDRNSENFGRAIERLKVFLDAEKSRTIFVPWRRDPHPDHRAAFQLIDAAKNEKQQIIEYPIWLYELAESEDAPLENEVEAFRLDVNSVIETKQKAIRAHRSQTTAMIDDDADGFRLSEEVLQNFAAPSEIYFRSKTND
jgi:LmbE family N-acetylglucosaminyl deacetylase